MGTIKISKESLERFKHDKEVVGATQRVPCPINEQADMHSDEMLGNLFDDAEYLEHSKSPGEYEVLGYVNEVPVVCTYWTNGNSMTISLAYPMYKARWAALDDILKKRLTDEQIEPDIVRLANVKEDGPKWYIYFYYNEEWVKENIG